MLLSKTLFGQNLVLNPDFDQIVQHHGNLNLYLDTFYAKYWFLPTGGSVDIYRNSELPKEMNFNLSIHKPFETSVVSGDYCIGFFFMEFMGDMEHITGTLCQPLTSGQKYSVSFYIKMHPTTTPYIPKGMGYKLSRDSVVFKAVEFDDRGNASPFYDHLFADNKVYSDFEIDKYVLDTTWIKYSSEYIAKGGEKYITLGRFAYEDDGNLIQHFKELRNSPWKDMLLKYVKSDKSKVCKRFFDKVKEFDIEGHNYYYIDLVEVIPIDTLPEIVSFISDEMNNKSDFEKESISFEDYNYVDLDPMTSTPSEREIVIDKGFEGDLKMELGVRLKPLEKYVLEYGKDCKIIIINTGVVQQYSEMKYILEYPAKKLRKRPIRFYVNKSEKEEIERLKLEAEKIEYFSDSNFKGILIKMKS